MVRAADEYFLFTRDAEAYSQRGHGDHAPSADADIAAERTLL
jgi:hypothetical protein